MNETVIHLGLQTVVLLRSVVSSGKTVPEAGRVFQYFEQLGVNTEEAGTIYHRFSHDIASDTIASISENLCREINSALRFNEKVYLLLMVQDCLHHLHENPGFTQHLHYLFNCVGIDDALIEKFSEFLSQNEPAVPVGEEYLLLAPAESQSDEDLEGRWIETNIPKTTEVAGISQMEGLRSPVMVMFVDQIKSYVIRCLQQEKGYSGMQNQTRCSFQLLEPGAELVLTGSPVLTYSDLKSRFLRLQEKRPLTLVVDKVQTKVSYGQNKISTFSALETTGRLIGIVGKEGVGKSTLLKLLAGKSRPESGTIRLNGYDLWKTKYLLKGTIGYVPEEDLLYDELTVAENLSLTARLFYSHLSGHEIDQRVNQILSRLDLLEIKHVVVGTIFNKHIQPGQRRMINIALELLREPQILLVDNALSGLGMADASKVIKILHDYSFRGNLVITTISQADTNTFKCFDKIWILDEGGRLAYNGSVKMAPVYLCKKLRLAYHETDDVDPSALLDLINYKMPDREGHIWKRVIEPEEWHDLCLQEQVLHTQETVTKSMLPARMLKIPNLEVQLLIFSIRNFKCKFSRIPSILRTLLTGPVTALLIALVFRIPVQGPYSLSANDNLPLYLFISTVVAIFLGLVLSADEILRERNVLEKETYLEFSRFSYINSKILYLFPVIGLQTFLYVLTGNLILGIHGMLGFYWLLLFSLACFGVLLGLTFSACVNRSDILYKRLLPIAVGLQLLLGGGIIPYDRLNLGSGKYTPLLGDLMASKWGYEALAVRQFTGNPYEKMFYGIDKKISQASFYSNNLIPKLQETLTHLLGSKAEDSVRANTALLKNEMNRMSGFTDLFPFEYINNLQEIPSNPSLAQETKDYLTYVGLHFYNQYTDEVNDRQKILDSIARSPGKERIEVLRKDYHNRALENLVTNHQAKTPYTLIDNTIVWNTGNIYQEPTSNFGRSRLFLPMKMLNGQKTETIWFDLSVIWLFTAICYLLVLFDAGALFRNLHLFK